MSRRTETELRAVVAQAAPGLTEASASEVAAWAAAEFGGSLAVACSMADAVLPHLVSLAAWSFDDLLAYATEHDVTLNPLLTDGYPSIGCQPCTSRIAPGDDPRSGRWAGLAKTECGIHP